MSASREKKKRQELYESGEIIQQPKKKSSGALPGWANWLIGIGAIAILVIFIGFIITTSNPFLKNVTAVSVGDTDYSAAESNYFYWDAVNTTANYYGEYFQYFVDTSKSYESQQYSEDMSWADFFMETAGTSMQQITILCDEAEKNGHTLTAEELKAIEDSYAALEAEAAKNNWPSAESYLKAFYGKATTKDSYMEYLTRQALASSYYSKLVQSYEYTDAELDSYYAEHKNDFDTVSFRLLTISSSVDGMTADEAKAEAERIAAATVNKEAAFIEEAKALYETAMAATGAEVDTEYDADANTLIEDVNYNNVGGAYVEWVFDEARIGGETYVAEVANADGTTTFAVVYFIERSVLDYELVNVRHILISAEDSTDSASMEAAKAEAEEILAQWESGDATEDSFAALANEKSTDPGSNTNGGLYEGVYQGQMVETFDAWCFDESRQFGDTGIVETTYGYHVMFYSGTSEETYLDKAVDSTLRNADYAEWYTGMQEQYPVEQKGFGTLFVNK